MQYHCATIWPPINLCIKGYDGFKYKIDNDDHSKDILKGLCNLVSKFGR